MVIDFCVAVDHRNENHDGNVQIQVLHVGAARQICASIRPGNWLTKAAREKQEKMTMQMVTIALKAMRALNAMDECVGCGWWTLRE